MQPASSTGKAAGLLMKAGKFQKASHTLAEALNSGASSPAMHLQLAECYLEMESYESAVRLTRFISPCHTCIAYPQDLRLLISGQDCMASDSAKHPAVTI